MPKRTELSPKGNSKEPTRRASRHSEIDAFLQSAQNLVAKGTGSRGRLIFALDATMSRQPTWDMACALQGEMFSAAASIGTLLVQLVYFRGYNEIRASRWVTDGETLRRLMQRIECQGGITQIQRVLSHARKQAKKEPLAALVYVGDSIEENVDILCGLAGDLALRNVKAFMFHDGPDQIAENAFREIARLTGGAYLPFDSASARELKALLGAVAVYAAGGRKALENDNSASARRLLADMR